MLNQGASTDKYVAESQKPGQHGSNATQKVLKIVKSPRNPKSL